MHRSRITPPAVLLTALLAIAIGSSRAEAEPEAVANKALAPYKNGFPPPVPNLKVKTKIELDENAQGLLVRSEKSYQEAQDHVARYLEDTYLKKLRQHYPKQKDVQVKVAKNPSAEGLLIHENLDYARWGKRAMVLDLYLPSKHDGPLLVVIWVNGGGWQWGSHRTYRSAAMKLAKLGFATVCVEYRLAGEATFPAAVYDVKAATRWLRAHAEKYDLAPRRIGITGGSAGGNIAVLSAVTFGDKRFEGPGNHLEQSSEIQCMVSLYGAMSWTVPQWAGSHQPPELHRETTPDFHIMNGSPLPPILFLNEWDRRSDRRWGADTMQWIKENKKTHTAELRLTNAPHAFIHFEPHQDQAVQILAKFFHEHLPASKNPASDSFGQPLKVLSWNILDSINGGKAARRGIQWVKEKDADVLALQESGNTTESLKKLAAQWGHDYSVNLKKHGDPVALTSKQPIEVIEKRVKGFHHGYLHCKTYGVHFFVVHFWPGKTDEVDIILDKIKPLLASGEKVIVLGDFNSRSRSDSGFNLQGKGFESYEMTDAFEAGGFIDTTHKHDKKAFYSFASPVLIPRWSKTMEDVKANRRRIDYIFADKALSRYSVSGTILHSDELDTMSDHYPVQTIFRLPRQVYLEK